MTDLIEHYIDITETVNPSIRYALMEQFSNPTLALLELVDNSVASKLPDKHLEVRITINPKRISITDKGGRGMNIEDLRRFLIWGLAPRTSIFQFHGQGGKAAIGYLANNFTLYSTPIEENTTYYTEVVDWSKTMDEQRTLRFEIRNALFEFPTVTFNLTGLKKQLRPSEAKRCLAETYRPLLLNGSIEIWVNSSKVIATDIPYESRNDVNEATTFGPVRGWVGLKPDNSSFRGGIRCYAQGRLITKREFFGVDRPSFNFEGIVGELDLGFVPFITLKTEFDRASEQWQAVQRAMDPKLRGLTKQVGHVSGDMKDLEKMMPDIKRVITEIFQQAQESFGTGGRLPPKRRGRGKRAQRKEHQISLTTPITPPPDKPTGILPRQGGWRVERMDESRRSCSDENGIILVNSIFPAFKTTFQLRARDLRPFHGHIAETIALEWYTRDGTPPSEIKERVNHILKVAYER